MLGLEVVAFGTNDIDNVLKNKSAAEIDKLAFGAISSTAPVGSFNTTPWRARSPVVIRAPRSA